jgi:hypothetical protein
MQQVAELAGVSTALVSLVMRDAPNVSDYRRQLVLAAADELGYRPNVLARNLASRRTQTIGVVLNDLHNPFFAEIADGLQAAADNNGYRLLIGNASHSQLGEERSVETFLQFRTDGLVIARLEPRRSWSSAGHHRAKSSIRPTPMTTSVHGSSSITLSPSATHALHTSTAVAVLASSNAGPATAQQCAPMASANTSTSSAAISPRPAGDKPHMSSCSMIDAPLRSLPATT